MGYETKLLIGQSCFSSQECKRGALIVEDGEAYRPYLKDKDGLFIETGRMLTYFMVMATIDLCKCGSDSSLLKLDWKNSDEKNCWYWYDGNQERIDDLYGDKPKPLPISDVLSALKKDSESSDYRRFKWAISLLESMKEEKELTVLLYGH